MSQPERTSRRDFLTGKPVRNSIGSKTTVPEDLSVKDQTAITSLRRQSAYLEQYSKNAMACEFELFFNLHQYPTAGIAAAKAFQLIDQLEDQMTVYRSHSEVSQINQTASQEHVKVESHLFGVFALAKQIYQETEGAFDITSAALTKLWRFDRRSGSLPTQAEIETTLKNVGSHLIQLDQAKYSIRFTQNGIQINLGGIGKGHALDRVGQMFLESGINDFVIHGGQSSVLALGNSTSAETKESGEPETGWTIGISHPTVPAVRLAEICLRNRSLGTSGTGRQGFFHEGQRYGHIIDPRTGWPASQILSSTVITESAAHADALATAFFVMHPDQVAAYCEQHSDIGAVLVLPNDSTGRVVVERFNLGAHELKLLI